MFAKSGRREREEVTAEHSLKRLRRLELASALLPYASAACNCVALIFFLQFSVTEVATGWPLSLRRFLAVFLAIPLLVSFLCGCIYFGVRGYLHQVTQELPAARRLAALYKPQSQRATFINAGLESVRHRGASICAVSLLILAFLPLAHLCAVSRRSLD